MFRPSYSLAQIGAALAAGTPLAAQKPHQHLALELRVMSALAADAMSRGGAPYSRRNRDRSKYEPHQGKREMARRAAALAKT